MPFFSDVFKGAVGSLDRENQFISPPMPNYTSIPNLTPDLAPRVNEIGKLYGNFLRSRLNQPSLSFDEYFEQAGGPGALKFALPEEYGVASSALRERPTAAGPVDTGAAYRAAIEDAQRQFTQYTQPAIMEKFGVRGGRYGSPVAQEIARAYGDVQSRLGAAGAQARVGAEESAANRNLQAESLWNQRLAGLTDVGTKSYGVGQANLERIYRNFLRTQPDAYTTMAQAFLGARPIAPQTLVGGSPVMTEKASPWDYLSSGMGGLSSLISMGGNLAKGFIAPSVMG